MQATKQHRFFEELFAQIDRLDVKVFDAFTENGSFQLGNNPPVTGRASIHAFMGGFFGAIGGIKHELSGCWTVDERSFCEGKVSYVRKDGSELTVPWATVSRFDGGKLAEHKICRRIEAVRPGRAKRSGAGPSRIGSRPMLQRQPARETSHCQGAGSPRAA